MSVDWQALGVLSPEMVRQLKTERDDYRAALLDAIEEMESMIPYVPDYFRDKWGYDEAIAKAKAAAQTGRVIERPTREEMPWPGDDEDDPLEPFMPVGGDAPFRDWTDFVDRVARPLVESDGDVEIEQAAMRLYRLANPYFVCIALVMAANRAGLDGTSS